MDAIQEHGPALAECDVDYRSRCEILEGLLRHQYAECARFLAAIETQNKTIRGLRDSNEGLRRRNGILKALLREKEKELP